MITPHGFVLQVLAPPGTGIAHARRQVEQALAFLAHTCEHRPRTPKRRPRQKRPLAPSPGGLFTLKQAAVALGMGERTLRDHVRSGAIRYVDIGHGKVRRAPRFAPQDLTEFQEKHRGTSWPSTSGARSTTMSSSFEVLDFAALRAARRSGKPAPSSGRSGKRRRRKPTVIKL